MSVPGQTSPVLTCSILGKVTARGPQTRAKHRTLVVNRGGAPVGVDVKAVQEAPKCVIKKEIESFGEKTTLGDGYGALLR